MSVVSCPGDHVSVRAGGCRDAVVPVSELRISLQVAAAAAATHRGLYTLYTLQSTVCCSVITPPRVTTLRDNTATVTLVTRESSVTRCHGVSGAVIVRVT